MRQLKNVAAAHQWKKKWKILEQKIVLDKEMYEENSNYSLEIFYL